MKPFMSFVLAFALSGVAYAGVPVDDSQRIASANLPDGDEAGHWVNAILKQGRIGGSPARMRYQVLSQDRANLDAAIAYFSTANPDLLPSDAHRVAFWLNAYNVSMIDAVLKHGGGSSSYSVSQSSFSIFDEPTHLIAGQRFSLNEIEHGVIRGVSSKVRPGFKAAAKAAHGGLWGSGGVDARIHMALNCASMGCPELAAEAYDGDRLNAQLKKQSQKYVADAKRGAGPNGISELFKWYGSDFAAVGGVEAFIAQHAPAGADINYDAFLSYDWSLNRK